MPILRFFYGLKQNYPVLSKILQNFLPRYIHTYPFKYI